MRKGSTVARQRGERGSALLIVLVFSAVLLIMLYKEIPIATFEAQRQKEQLAIDRGHEYQRAVQLFYRNNGRQYPASLDQLENTNGVRFLRRKYKDPMTGKDDWRLLHAGPGGMLTDSKVTPIGLNANGTNGNNGGNSFGNNTANGGQPSNGSAFGSSSSFGGSSFGTNSSSTDTAAEPTDTSSLDGQGGAKRHSAPAIAAAGSGDASGTPDALGNAATPSSADLNADPSKPLLPSTPDQNSGTQSAANQNGGNPNAQAGAGQQSLGTAGAPTAGQSAMNAVMGNNANGNRLGSFNTGTGNAFGAGGIAGVAIPAEVKGRSIKKVNDQDQYPKWEFYYDPSKDNGAGGAGTQNNGAQVAPGLGNTGLGSNGAAQSGIQIGGSTLGGDSGTQQNTPQPAPSGQDSNGTTPPTTQIGPGR